MGQILHGSAKTTHAVRAAIQRSKPSIQELAGRYDLNSKTVMKWRKRTFFYDAPMGRRAGFLRSKARQGARRRSSGTRSATSTLISLKCAPKKANFTCLSRFRSTPQEG
jgi:hypothetical protein